jgi:hypothetical protein
LLEERGVRGAAAALREHGWSATAICGALVQAGVEASQATYAGLVACGWSRDKAAGISRGAGFGTPETPMQATMTTAAQLARDGDAAQIPPRPSVSAGGGEQAPVLCSTAGGPPESGGSSQLAPMGGFTRLLQRPLCSRRLATGAVRVPADSLAAQVGVPSNQLHAYHVGPDSLAARLRKRQVEEQSGAGASSPGPDGSLSRLADARPDKVLHVAYRFGIDCVRGWRVQTHVCFPCQPDHLCPLLPSLSSLLPTQLITLDCYSQPTRECLPPSAQALRAGAGATADGCQSVRRPLACQ